MSVVIEIESPITEKIKNITGEDSDRDAIRVALERFVRDYGSEMAEQKTSDLPDEYWDDLFSSPQLPGSHSGSQAIIDERNEDRF